MESIENPKHYGGVDNIYEAIKVIDAWEVDFYLGNVLKYICRAGKKTGQLEDLKKAQWYLNKKIQKMEERKVTYGETHRITNGFDLY